VIGRAVAIAAWTTTMLVGVVMFWTLTAGGFLAAMAQGQATVSESVLLLSYLAIGSIVAVTMSYATVGLLLATRAGGGRVGTVLLAGGLSFVAIPFGYVVGGTLVLRDPFDPLANAVFLIGPACIPIGYSLILPVIALVFPDGRLPSARWRWPVRVIAAFVGTASAITILRPGEIAGTASRNPFGIDAMPSAVSDLAGLLSGLGIVAISLVGAAAVVVRYRRGSFVERQQLRWFLAAVLLAIVPIAISPQNGIGGPFWILVAAVGLLLLPVSVGIAVLRYRLYEIDRLISRGLSWALLSGLLVAVYAGTILVLQNALGGVTQGETLSVAASTLLAAALFQPLRGRVQRAMDRRVDRARYDGARVVGAFAERLRGQIDLGSLGTEVRRVAAETVRPTTSAVWIRIVPESREVPGS
jgi:hypothetical protein